MATVSSIVESTTSAARLRWWRGLSCCATFLVTPLGGLLPPRHFRCVDAGRLDRGLVLILPGIEGRSFLNLSALNGLIDAEVPYALEVHDWTTGYRLLTLYHLRAWRRNQRVAREIARRIQAYQAEYPGRPVWLVGHSGGGGMALLTAAALPAGSRITGIVLLAAAVSRRFDVSAALAHVERGIWSFHSRWDCFFVGLGTTVFGCFDGRHGPAAGMVGFHRQVTKTSEVSEDFGSLGSSAAFEQIEHSWTMARQFHIGGHFGCVHRVFIAETVAPLMKSDAESW
jgi:pimeloyl-ACP methyl ester carboxylesterase